MFKFLTKQLIYGRIYLWIKDKLGAILFLFISIFLIIYFHNEYLKYIEYKVKFAESYVGLSFVIKNILILLVAGGYFYFYFLDANVLIFEKMDVDFFSAASLFILGLDASTFIFCLGFSVFSLDSISSESCVEICF